MRGLVAFALLILMAGCNLGASQDVVVPPTPDLPRVSFQFPQNNARVVEGFEVVVDILATDSTLGVQRIEFYVDRVLVQQGESPEGVVALFRVNTKWTAQGLGIHTLSAIAYRPDGTPGDEMTILIEVIPPS
jgi:hypothetical protein